MYIPLNGPAVQGALSVTTSPIEVKVGASVLDERVMVSIQPIDGDVYFGYDSGTLTASTGTKIFKGQYFPLEASFSLPIYLISASGTINVRITEVA